MLGMHCCKAALHKQAACVLSTASFSCGSSCFLLSMAKQRMQPLYGAIDAAVQ
jgi:hypothetical protein